MRRRRPEKRQITPDVEYNSELVGRLINTVMRNGKKATAQHIVYDAFKVIAEKKKGAAPLEVFLQALENIKPRLEVKSRRVGGASYQVPIEISPERQVALAMRWLCDFSHGRSGKTMSDSLAAELMDAFDNTGSAVKKKDDMHKMAAANQAFAHYRW